MNQYLYRFFCLAALLGAASASAIETQRTVAVSGSCVRNAVPDRGAVTLTAEAKDADAKRAQTAANRQYEAIRSKAAGLKLPDSEISTSEYTSEEIKEWEKDRMVSRGFRTRISLRVETSDTARLGEVMDLGSREGIKQISGMQIFVSSKKMLEERMLCLKDASAQAKAKAETLAHALGAKVGDVISIQENSSPFYPPPQPIFATSMAMEGSERGAAPKIEPGKVEVNVSVNVTFGLR